MDNTYIKPGWKTTEFWTMLCSVFFGILILTGVMTNTESNDMLAYMNNIMGCSVTIVSAASYILSRGKAKQNVSVDYAKLIMDIKQLVDNSDKK